MLIKRPDDIKPSEITDPKLYFSRRRFLRTSTGAMVVATVPGANLAVADARRPGQVGCSTQPLVQP